MNTNKPKEISTFDAMWFDKFNSQGGVEFIKAELTKTLQKLLSNGINIAHMMNNPKTGLDKLK